MAATLAGKVAELNLGQYEPELLKLAVRHAVSPAEAASYLREIQACTSKALFSSPHVPGQCLGFCEHHQGTRALQSQPTLYMYISRVSLPHAAEQYSNSSARVHLMQSCATSDAE